jgi:hypothetical protein
MARGDGRWNGGITEDPVLSLTIEGVLSPEPSITSLRPGARPSGAMNGLGFGREIGCLIQADCA